VHVHRAFHAEDPEQGARGRGERSRHAELKTRVTVMNWKSVGRPRGTAGVSRADETSE
jgi:hypothetical protein